MHVCMYLCVHMEIAFLVKEYSAGSYPLHRPAMQGSHAAETATQENVASPTTEDTKRTQCSQHQPHNPDHDHSTSAEAMMLMDHEFVVCVCGVTGVDEEAGVVWGEADCYIQYHFPTLTQHSTSDSRSSGAAGDGECD